MKDEKIVHTSTKGILPYQVTDTIYNNRPSRVLFTKNRAAAESGIALDNKKELLFDYNERFMELIRGLLPKRILLLGGGAFTLPTAVNREFPNISVDIVELDPELYKIAQKYFHFKPNSKTRIYIEDAISYLESTDQRYDLIIVDVFLNNLIPAPFQTKKFTKNLKIKLTKRGIVAMNVIATYNGRSSISLSRLISMFKSSFKSVQLFPAGNGLSLWISQNFVITAQNHVEDIQVYIRYKSLGLPKIDWRRWLIT